MPLVHIRKAIRFKTYDKMINAMNSDAPYQCRHLIIEYLNNARLGGEAPCTRREISDNTDVPINVISNVILTMLGEGVVREAGKMECRVTGRMSRSLVLNTEYTGPF